MDIPAVSTDSAEDGRVPLVLMAVDPLAVAALVELVRLFSKAIDSQDLGEEDVIVRQDVGQPAHILIPEYLELTAKDVIALATGRPPGDMSPEDVTTYLYEFSGLIGDLWKSVPSLELPCLVGLLATHGLPVQRPGTDTD